MKPLAAAAFFFSAGAFAMALAWWFAHRRTPTGPDTYQCPECGCNDRNRMWQTVWSAGFRAGQVAK